MPKTIVKIDLKESPYKNELIHNRWHPDIPIIEWVRPGEDFVMETYDWTGGFIKNNESADDVRDIDLSIVHFLSGPIGVHGAEPGDSWSSIFSTSARRRRPARCRRANTAAIATLKTCRAAQKSTSRSM
jgi:hypothetical protein